MSFVSNALGINNGYTATSGAGPNSTIQQQTDTTNLNNTFGAQTNLANMLNAQANGQGPNIANLQLQQATNQNNQQAAAAVGSQRGMNPALAQRIISQQTAMNNQNAAGQSGVLRAQQQIAAQQGLANVYGQQAGEANQNFNTLTGAQSSANQANAQIAQNNTNQNAGIAGGILNGGSSMLSSILAHGGEVGDPKHMEIMSVPTGNKVHPLHLAGGGGIFGSWGSAPTNTIFGPLSAGQNVTAAMGPAGGGGGASPTSGATSMQGSDDSEFGGSSIGDSGVSGLPGAASSGGDLVSLVAAHGAKVPNYDLGGLLKLAALFAQGGKVPAMVSPGERFIPPEKVDAVASGKESVKSAGKKFPGKAKVKGDNEKNDTVKVALAPGGVVVPRTKAENDEDAREFLLAIKADKEKKQGPSGYAKILAAKRKNAS